MANLGRKQVTLWLYTWDLVADYPKQGCCDEYMTGHAPTAPTRPPPTVRALQGPSNRTEGVQTKYYDRDSSGTSHIYQV